MSNKITMTEREKLYNEIWDEPMTIVSKKYGISDVALRKRCVNAEIPIPPRGYWAKIHANKIVKQTPLPTLSSIGKQHVREHTVSLNKELDKYTEEELLLEDPLYIFSDYTKEIINNVRKTLKVPLQLRNPHPFILQHEEQITGRVKHERLNKQYNGLLKPDEYYTFSQCNILKIQVTQQHLKRAYRIIDTILKQIEEMEGSASISNYYKQDGGSIYIGGACWSFELFEKVTHSKDGNKGELTSIYISFVSTSAIDRHETKMIFSDKKDSLLELQVGEIIYQLFVSSGYICQQNELERRNLHRLVEEENHRIEKKLKIENERKKVNSALKEAHQYHQAKELRTYAEAYKAFHKENNTLGKASEEHYQWLIDKADWIDPFIKKKDLLLDIE